METSHLPGLSDQNFLNALADESAQFILVPNVSLKEQIIKGEHPAVQRLPVRYQRTLLNCPDGTGINLGREIVKRYASGASSSDERFILDRCDILCVGHPNTKLPAAG
jgi:hypothetical protein